MTDAMKGGFKRNLAETEPGDQAVPISPHADDEAGARERSRMKKETRKGKKAKETQ